MSLSIADLDRHWTVADWRRLPDDDPHRYEIVDGNLHVSPAPTLGHLHWGSDLRDVLAASAPPGWRCTTEAPVVFAPDHARTPDVVVYRWPLRSPGSDQAHPLGPSDVGLVLEVVSPRSRRTDRFVKPQEYAEAGIGVFWRLETEPAPALHTFTLVDGAYVAGPIITASGRAPTPWGDITVDLTALLLR